MAIAASLQCTEKVSNAVNGRGLVADVCCGKKDSVGVVLSIQEEAVDVARFDWPLS